MLFIDLNFPLDFQNIGDKRVQLVAELRQLSLPCTIIRTKAATSMPPELVDSDIKARPPPGVQVRMTTGTSNQMNANHTNQKHKPGLPTGTSCMLSRFFHCSIPIPTRIPTRIGRKEAVF